MKEQCVPLENSFSLIAQLLASSRLGWPNLKGQSYQLERIIGRELSYFAESVCVFHRITQNLLSKWNFCQSNNHSSLSLDMSVLVL